MTLGTSITKDPKKFKGHITKSNNLRIKMDEIILFTVNVK